MNDDHLLIKQSCQGNEAAKAELYDKYELGWFRLCLRYGRSRAEAQDMFQEGAVKVFQVLNKYDVERGSFGAWSNRVIINIALKYLQKYQWQQSFEDLEAVENEPDISVDILEQITMKELIEIVQQLPAGYRMVFNMHEIEGYNHREIAEILNISIGTSKSQLFKAKKLLQQKLNILF